MSAGDERVAGEGVLNYGTIAQARIEGLVVVQHLTPCGVTVLRIDFLRSVVSERPGQQPHELELFKELDLCSGACGIRPVSGLARSLVQLPHYIVALVIDRHDGTSVCLVQHLPCLVGTVGAVLVVGILVRVRIIGVAERIDVAEVRGLRFLPGYVKSEVEFQNPVRSESEVGLEIVAVVVVPDQESGIVGVANPDIIVVFL